MIEWNLIEVKKIKIKYIHQNRKIRQNLVVKFILNPGENTLKSGEKHVKLWEKKIILKIVSNLINDPEKNKANK